MTFYDYHDACEGEVTREEARLEIEQHDLPGAFEEFLKEVGDKETYTGKEVLDWLGV